ncbi:MAG: hypothetical protein ACI37O_01540 [Candidatus Avelusimicrobium sp.]|uniref:hypothetical protein n=1 Tax=Candidatus Avelusimicrobium sp. TaxID=3048833 RepID=UPI003F014174
MCKECEEKAHDLYIKDKYIRRLERKMQYKPSLSTLIGLITVIGFMGSVLLFSFKTYFDHNNTVILAQSTRTLAEKNREELTTLKYETTKELALLNQSMTRVLKLLEDR